MTEHDAETPVGLPDEPEVEVPEEEPVADEDTMPQEEADADETVDNAERDEDAVASDSPPMPAPDTTPPGSPEDSAE